jgi:hypothetical protein
MSRQQSVLRNTVGYMLTNIDNQTTDGEEKSKPEVIKLGLDLHARQVTECRQPWTGTNSIGITILYYNYCMMLWISR